ncbi:pyridoxamine 5'-phosphate oxidase family protein [Kribbella sp. VKM Ac-2566]|uniref:pyridoxamine 5'-phosphate oxidase family protein n=1 Tax=Kribbella sp. VKM Ac-2566 TaxID=2512218 RepID=UPI0010642FF9|nr:pyridoxamine 5'-phosphate oxidase family protein [Kribbella sp. VKM Ac-2566]TDW92312.1 pyridoxamine 5'-phosphate oxidase [Kribbella sp. VKM Ac-2566]
MTALTEEDTMRWAEIESRQPRLIEFGRRRLLDPGVVLVATIRRDGTARLSPVEPYVMDGDLWLSMMWGSTKARDLLRDPRILVHSVITSRDGGEGEYKVRGRAEPTDDAAIQRRYADAVADALGWRPVPGHFHLFAVDVTDITVIRYDDATGDQFVARWPDGREFVRRGTSATSVGEPETYHDLLRLSPA